MRSKGYFKDIDYIRLIACLGVLFYHLNVLKGGFLAVCVFFVLSGYLSCISAFKKKKFSLKDYYKNKFIKLYIPLLLVVMLTIGVVSLIPSINWMNLKPETFSVLLGYNNFWQLNANLDYFAMHINSPFMHLWYIAILLQFDLVFPFIYLGFRKLEKKFSKGVPCIISIILAIISVIYFFIVSLQGNIMVTYYNTFARLFSLLLGMCLGFIHTYYGHLVPYELKKEDRVNKIFIGYLVILVLSFIFIDSTFKELGYMMILVSLIACRLIDYGTLPCRKKASIFDKAIISNLASVSYVVYLVQYPIIYLLQLVNTKVVLNVLIVTLGSFVLGYLFKYILNFKNKEVKFKYLKMGLTVVILAISLFGSFKFVTAKDYRAEMQKLEDKIHENEDLVKQKQEEYAKQFEEKKENWADILTELENGESTLEEKVHQLPVVGIGDSVMLGAVNGLYKQFPNSYVDAKVSRTAWSVKDIIVDLKSKKLFEGPVVLNLGTNGDCSEKCKKAIVDECGDREIFWVNVTNDEDVHVNEKLLNFANQYDNVHLIDWNTASKGHDEYFYADGIHLTSKGIKAYSEVIYSSIYNVYLDNFNKEKEDLLNQYKEDITSKYLFIGNEILINSFDKLHDVFENAKYVTDKEFNYNKVIETITKEKEDELLPDKIILEFDNSISFTKEEYQEIIKLCEGKELYILVTNNHEKSIVEDLLTDNIHVIDFTSEFSSTSNYLDVDGIHLNEDGNQALILKIKESIN